MKNIPIIIILLASIYSCDKSNENMKDQIKIVFLHHSTGQLVLNGKYPSIIRRITNKLSMTHSNKGRVQRLIERYNKENNTNYKIESIAFPKKNIYGWNNYPFDYYNIWVAHAGSKPYKDEPTLEMLSKEYDIIIWKHCFPVSKIKENTGKPDITSDEKRLENYKIQYEALKNKMKEFKDIKFIVWTGPALLESATNPEEALRADEFFRWVRKEWNEPGDNVFIWDFRTIETKGSIYLPDNYSIKPGDSHPNKKITDKASKLFVKRIIDVIENNGSLTDLQGNLVH